MEKKIEETLFKSCEKSLTTQKIMQIKQFSKGRVQGNQELKVILMKQVWDQRWLHEALPQKTKQTKKKKENKENKQTNKKN